MYVCVLNVCMHASLTFALLQSQNVTFYELL